jgi:hypothetical protein
VLLLQRAFFGDAKRSKRLRALPTWLRTKLSTAEVESLESASKSST